MRINRRSFLSLSAAALAAPAVEARERTRFRIGVTDWNLRKSSDPAAVELASRCGFAGVQVALGRELRNGKLPLDDAALQQKYLAESKKHAVALTSTCVNRLHVNYLKDKSDELAARWVSDSIRITQALGLRVLLLPFFGKGAIEQRAEMDVVGDWLREIAPEAERADVILGLEDTISAEDNLYIMERAQTPAVLTYYDIGNSTRKGFDPVQEIRLLGSERICEVHIKDNPHFLGEGSINIPGVVDSMAEIGFAEWAVLETTARKEAVVADMKHNLGFFRQAIDSHNSAA